MPTCACCRSRRWRSIPASRGVSAGRLAGTASLALWALNLFFAMLGVGPANAAVQMITPNQMRGQIRAAYQFVFNVVGFGAGPFLVALFTDYVFHDDAALRYSLASVAAIIGPVAALLTWYGMKPYAACVVRARAWT